MKKTVLKIFRFFGSFLFILAAVLLVIVSPFARSLYVGDNTGGLSCRILFRVYLWGNWFEKREFFGLHIETYSGSASAIGSSIGFPIAATIFITFALLLCIAGSIGFWSKIDAQRLKLSPEQLVQKQHRNQLLGGLCSLVGGFLGILGLVFFAFFKTTIIHPYTTFLPFTTIRFSFSFYYVLLLFVFYFASGFTSLLYHFKTGQILFVEEAGSEDRESSNSAESPTSD